MLSKMLSFSCLSTVFVQNFSDFLSGPETLDFGDFVPCGGVCGGYPPPALRPLGSVNAGPIILHGWWMPENAAGLRLHRVLFWHKDIHTKCVSTQKLGSYTNEGVQSQGPIGNYR